MHALLSTTVSFWTLSREGTKNHILKVIKATSNFAGTIFKDEIVLKK